MDIALLIIGLTAALGAASEGNISTSSFTNRMKHLDKCLHQEVLAVRNKDLVATAILSFIGFFEISLYVFRIDPVFFGSGFLLLCLFVLTVSMLGLYMKRTGDAFFTKLNWAILASTATKDIVSLVAVFLFQRDVVVQ